MSSSSSEKDMDSIRGSSEHLDPENLYRKVGWSRIDQLPRMGDIDLKRLEGILFEQAGADGLYEPEQESVDMTWKEKLKFYAPHVGLIVTSVVYSIGFAIAFHHIERPHELRTKNESLHKISILREKLVNSLWLTLQQRNSKSNWLSHSMNDLRNLTEQLFNAYNYHFVTMDDINSQKADRNNGSLSISPLQTAWSMPAAIFFATTTMTTIGYGNLVPVTFSGRILCVFFALLGTPLAIITIGDIGKFFSEYTIRLYQNCQTVKTWISKHSRRHMKKLSIRKASEIPSFDSKSSSAQDKESDYDPFKELADELIADKAQVPVLMVFAILIAYTAVGALFFASVEGWTYMDAFYFCFITLTTVGFGDLVPKKTKHYTWMLIYIGIGLAVTTMCIDLVGIQYIQKIHYFGRKFKGTEWLAKLKRRRMLERRLALAVQQMAATDRWLTNMPSRKESGLSHCVATATITPVTPSVPSWPMIHEFGADNVQLKRIYDLLRNTSRHSDSISGPDISLHCSISGNSSLSDRERMYFLRSLLPPSEWSPVPPTPSPDEMRGMVLMETWQETMAMLEESLKVKSFLPQKTPAPEEHFVHHLLSPLDYPSTSTSLMSSPCESVLDFADAEEVEFPSDSGLSTETEESKDEPAVYYRNMPVYSMSANTVPAEDAIQHVVNCPDMCVTQETPILVTENYCFVVDGDRVKLNEILMEAKDWWKPTGKPTKYYYSDDLKKFERVQLSFARHQALKARLQKNPKVEVDLSKVFKVSRYYSFWRSCPQFHRIVTVISPATDNHSWQFKNRIFVQYLWRNAKEEDKARVALEWNPEASKLFRQYASGDPTKRRRTFQF